MACFILTWNPEKFDGMSDEEWDRLARRKSPPARGFMWSTGNRSSGIKKGDRLIFLRQGGDRRGIIAIGEVAGSLEMRKHFNDPSRDSWYVRARWTEPRLIDERIPTEELRRKFPEIKWDRLQASGTKVSEVIASKIETLWRESAPPSRTETSEGSVVLRTSANVDVHQAEVLEIARATIEAKGPVPFDVIAKAIESRMQQTAGNVALSFQGRRSLSSSLTNPGRRMGFIRIGGKWTFATPERDAVFAESDFEGTPEGKRVLKQHVRAERDSSLIRRYKQWREQTSPDGKLRCDICSTCFEDKYGEIGVGFIECHHTVPVSEMEAKGLSETDPNTLTLVCPNCHRMLHRRIAMLAPSELKDVVRSRGWLEAQVPKARPALLPRAKRK